MIYLLLAKRNALTHIWELRQLVGFLLAAYK